MNQKARVWAYVGPDGAVVMVSVNGFRLADGHTNQEQANALAMSLGDEFYGVYDIRTNGAEFKKVL